MLLFFFVTQNHHWNLSSKATSAMQSLGSSDAIYTSVVGSEAVVEKLERSQVSAAKQRLICYAHANHLSLFDSDSVLYSVKQEGRKWNVRLLLTSSEARWISLYFKPKESWQAEARTLCSQIGLRAPSFSRPSEVKAACRSEVRLGRTSVLLPSDWHFESDVLGLSPGIDETSLRWKDDSTTWRVNYFPNELAWKKFADSQKLIVERRKPNSSLAKVSGARFGYVSMRHGVILISTPPSQNSSREIRQARDLATYLSAALR